VFEVEWQSGADDSVGALGRSSHQGGPSLVFGGRTAGPRRGKAPPADSSGAFGYRARVGPDKQPAGPPAEQQRVAFERLLIYPHLLGSVPARVLTHSRPNQEAADDGLERRSGRQREDEASGGSFGSAHRRVHAHTAAQRPSRRPIGRR